MTSAADDDGWVMPRWWRLFQRVVIFGLGVWTIVDALTEESTASSSTVKLIVGLVMVGVLPVEDIIRAGRHGGRHSR